MEAATPQLKKPSLLRAVVIGRRPKLTLVRIVLLVALIFLTRQFAILPIRSVGPSMLPTYQDNGVNFVNRLAYFTREPQRGDVVAIRTSGISIMYMKRVIGLPGETVEFKQGRVFINGVPLSEPYVKYSSDWTLAPVKVDPDKYFVVGDNRSMPSIYHYFGETERQRIIGRVMLCKNIFASSGLSR